MWWWKITIHRSILIALLCSGFVAGVACSMVLHVQAFWGLLAMVVCFACLFVSRRYVIPFACAISLVAGLGYGSAHMGAREVYVSYYEKTVTLKGHIKEDPSVSASGALSLQFDTVTFDSVTMPGTVYGSFRGTSQAKRGDYIVARGEVSKGFGSFPAKVSITTISNVIRPIPGDTGRVVRDWFADQVRKGVPEPQASLGIGFLTGQKSALTPDLADALKIAGLTHIVVSSGYNLTILVRVARKLLARVSKYASAVSASVMIVAFVAITGLSPSMTRAGLVSGMSLAAWYYGHAFHPFVLLPFAAAITVVWQPYYVWGDLGWQLSFSAFAAVMIVAPLLQRYFFGAKEPGVFRQILGETIAAHLVTIPIIALSFGTISHVAIIANLLVVPFVPIAMLLTFLVGVGEILHIAFIEILGQVTSWLLGYMVVVAQYVASLSWAQTPITAEGWVWVVYGVLLVAGCWWMWRATAYSFRSGESPL